MDSRYAAEMLACASRFAPQLQEYYCYCIGHRQEHLAGPLLARAPGAVPVLIGISPEELVRVRDALRPAEVMGFVADVFSPGWERELPAAPALIGITSLLGSVADRKKEAFLREAAARLRPGGVLIWSDLFLPQSLELYERYQAAEAEELCRNEPGLTAEAAVRRIAEYHRSLYGIPVLFDRARELLYDAGFGSVDAVWKQYGYAALVAVR